MHKITLIPTAHDPIAHYERSLMATGTVKWFNERKGFGFIVDPNVPTDIFVHFSAIQGDGYKTLNEGEEVEYEFFEDDKGTKARNVVRIK